MKTARRRGKVRHKVKRPVTRLWQCRLMWEKGLPIIFVSKGPVRSDGATRGMIRACTAKAAGRRYRRFIPHLVAGADHETDNPFSDSYMDLTPEMVKRCSRYKGLAEVRVVD